MALYQLGEHIPQIHETAHIADSADVIGQVEMAENSSVWYGVVVRADTDRIRIGRGSNIQDNSVLHTDAGIELVIGENVTDLAAEEVRSAIRALDSLVGRIDVENVLDEIFASFCLGK